MELLSIEDISAFLRGLTVEDEELSATYRGLFLRFSYDEPNRNVGMSVPAFSAHPWMGGSFRPGFFVTVETDWLQPFDMMLLPRAEKDDSRSNPLLSRFSLSATNPSLAARNLEGDLADALADLWERYSVAMNDKEICLGPIQNDTGQTADDIDLLITALISRKSEKRFSQRELQGYSEAESVEEQALSSEQVSKETSLRPPKRLKAVLICLALILSVFALDLSGAEETVELSVEADVVSIKPGSYFDVSFGAEGVERVSSFFSPVAFIVEPGCRFNLKYTRGMLSGHKWNTTLVMSDEQMRECETRAGNLFEVYNKKDHTNLFAPLNTSSSWNL